MISFSLKVISFLIFACTAFMGIVNAAEISVLAAKASEEFYSLHGVTPQQYRVNWLINKTGENFNLLDRMKEKNIKVIEGLRSAAQEKAKEDISWDKFIPAGITNNYAAVDFITQGFPELSGHTVEKAVRSMDDLLTIRGTKLRNLNPQERLINIRSTFAIAQHLYEKLPSKPRSVQEWKNYFSQQHGEIATNARVQATINTRATLAAIAVAKHLNSFEADCLTIKTESGLQENVFANFMAEIASANPITRQQNANGSGSFLSWCGSGMYNIGASIYATASTVGSGIKTLASAVVDERRRLRQGVDLYTPVKVFLTEGESNPTLQAIMTNPFTGRVYQGVVQQTMTDLDRVLQNLIHIKGPEIGGQLFHQFFGKSLFGNDESWIGSILTPQTYVNLSLPANILVTCTKALLNGMALAIESKGAIENLLDNTLEKYINEGKDQIQRASQQLMGDGMAYNVANFMIEDAGRSANKASQNTVKKTLEALAVDLKKFQLYGWDVGSYLSYVVTNGHPSQSSGFLSNAILYSNGVVKNVLEGPKPLRGLRDKITEEVTSKTPLKDSLARQKRANGFIGEMVSSITIDATFFTAGNKAKPFTAFIQPLLLAEKVNNFNFGLVEELLEPDELFPLQDLLVTKLEEIGKKSARFITMEATKALLQHIQRTDIEILDFLDNEQTTFHRAKKQFWDRL